MHRSAASLRASPPRRTRCAPMRGAHTHGGVGLKQPVYRLTWAEEHPMLRQFALGRTDLRPRSVAVRPNGLHAQADTYSQPNLTRTSSHGRLTPLHPAPQAAPEASPSAAEVDHFPLAESRPSTEATTPSCYVYDPRYHKYGDLRPTSAAGKRILRSREWDDVPAWRGGPRKMYTSPASPQWEPGPRAKSAWGMPREVATFGDSRNLRNPPRFLYR
ncbi:hypothetical protein AB1Y20_006044 [Prymnesium parvum]|uniref:RBPJ-interacting and tubulin-associated protein n=1 Tax=Prymnesium parvum TaxID=97485 RepID=A0AB34J158_PRYPA